MPPGPPLGALTAARQGAGSARGPSPARPPLKALPRRRRGTSRGPRACRGRRERVSTSLRPEPRQRARTFPVPSLAVRGPCACPWSVFSPHTRCRRPGLFPFARGPRVSPAPVPRQPAHASGYLCARHTTGGNHGTPANHPAAEQPAAPYKQLCKSRSNCSVPQRSSRREQKPCQWPQEGGDVSEVGTTWPRHLDDAVSGAFSASACIVAMHPYHSSPTGAWSWPTPLEKIKLAQSKQHRAVTFALAPPGPAQVWKQSGWVY